MLFKDIDQFADWGDVFILYIWVFLSWTTSCTQISGLTFLVGFVGVKSFFDKIYLDITNQKIEMITDAFSKISDHQKLLAENQSDLLDIIRGDLK